VLDTGNADSVHHPQIAVDSAGNAFAVWSQGDSNDGSIWVNRYEGGSGWGDAKRLDTVIDGWNRYPQVAVDATGNAFVIWSQSDGTKEGIWASRYVDGSGWGAVERVTPEDAGGGEYPRIAADAAGNAIAVWQHIRSKDPQYRFSVWANRYVVGSGWGSSEVIESDNERDANYPRVAVDPAGNAVAVWRQIENFYPDEVYNIWGNRYTVGSGWGTAEPVDIGDGGVASEPRVAMDSAGNAVTVWSQNDGTRDNVYSNRYSAGSGWDGVELIESDADNDAREPEVAVSRDGKAVVVWVQCDGACFEDESFGNIWASRYDSF
jgi:hypothetical protein